MPLNLGVLMSRRVTALTQRYGHKDTILYALAVGAGRPTTTGEDLKFVYEDGLQALPTLATVLACPRFWASDSRAGIDSRYVLHSAQTLTMHRILAPKGIASSETHVTGVYDKGPGRGAIVHTTRRLWDEYRNVVADIGTAIFIRNAGGFGGHRYPRVNVTVDNCGRSADEAAEIVVRPDQSLIYRLTGDDNALHVDPQAAKAAGFDRPILHGLCTYGIVGRAILELCCEDKPQRLARLDTYFTSPVYPGETLRVEVWRRSLTELAFRCLALPRGVVVLDGGYAQLTSHKRGRSD